MVRGYPTQRLSAPGIKEHVIGGLAAGLGGRIPSTTFRKQQLATTPQVEPRVQSQPAEQSSTVYDPETGVLCVLCQHCRLPIGDRGYNADKDGCHLHGECKAQAMLKESKKEEEARLKKDAALKKKLRAQYDLGWKVERVPRHLKT